MKKFLVAVLLIGFILSGCMKERVPAEILAETEFDGMKITFYYDASIMDGDGLYYANDRDGFQYPHHYVLNSSDYSTIFFVDLSEYLVYEDDFLVEPMDRFIVKTHYGSCEAAIYHLDATKECWRIGKNQKEFRLLSCAEGADGKSMICSGGFELSAEEYERMGASWKEIENPDETIEYQVFMSVRDNKVPISSSNSVPSETFYAKAEISDDQWIVRVEKEDVQYYELNGEQILALKNLS